MRDYKPTPARPERGARWLLWFIAGLGLPLVAVAILLPDSSAPPMLPSDSPVAISAAPDSDAATGLAAPAPIAEVQPILASEEVPVYVAAPEPLPEGERSLLRVKSGDSLDKLFRRNGFSPAELALIMRDEAARKHLRLIRPGDEIEVWHQDRQIVQLNRPIDYARSLEVRRAESGFEGEIVEHRLFRKQVEARGRINSSLFLAAADAGISDRIIMNLAGIFAWDIDFVLDIRQGDEFQVIVEEIWRDGERVAEGEILAAKFVNQGREFTAIRYEDPQGRTSYFTPDGRNLRKAFLRAPLQFSRISSNFNPNRRHPVLNRIRAHNGVDYAAPHGTPVMAAGDGKVIFRGVKGGYGNTVILQHGGNITTLYAHLSNFNRQARLGTRVKQGSTIAYVGQSGLATGPHLHYEYRKNGVHKNPRTVSLPDAAPIDPAYRAAFIEAAQPFIARLNQPNTVVSQANAVASY